MSFFRDDLSHFFKPLNGKYREVAVGCLKAFHDRIYGPNADYGHHIQRDDLRDTFVNVIQLTPILSDDEDEDFDVDAADERQFAGALIRTFIKCGWIEEFTDKATLVRAFRFTRTGKAFTSVFVGLDAPKMRTRQRNVRSTRNSLEAFLKSRDPYDLVDAISFSRQVVDDFNEDIAFLYDARKILMREAAENRALDFFIDYTERVFVNDIAIRFSADSIERHRARIDEVIQQIRELPAEVLGKANAGLEGLLPDEIGRFAGSPVERSLDAIEMIVAASCDNKIQELRNALTGFVSRARLLAHQASVLQGGFGENRLPAVVGAIASADRQEQDRMLQRMADEMSCVDIGLVDPGQMKPKRKTNLRQATTVTVIPAKTREDLLKAAIQSAHQAAFEVSPQKIKQKLLHLIDTCGAARLSLLPAASADDVLAMLHAVEAASIAVQPEGAIEVKVTGEMVETPYATFEDLILRRPL